MAIEYTAELRYEDREDDYIRLMAKSDEAARREADGIAKANPLAQVFCSFFRARDQQRGYINRDGASPLGRSY